MDENLSPSGSGIGRRIAAGSRRAPQASDVYADPQEHRRAGGKHSLGDYPADVASIRLSGGVRFLLEPTSGSKSDMGKRLYSADWRRKRGKARSRGSSNPIG